jgi:aspartyl-tRNA(Asn)/glutamyl-tRNA(Gln) amidotransferase subunit C
MVVATVLRTRTGFFADGAKLFKIGVLTAPWPGDTEEKFMALTREEVLHVADLARLSLLPEEIELFTRQLNDILAYVEKLQELDTTGVEPLAHVIPVFNVFREDVVSQGLDRDAALSNAPAREEGALVVPRII